jgi:hypothetical protein
MLVFTKHLYYMFEESRNIISSSFYKLRNCKEAFPIFGCTQRPLPRHHFYFIIDECVIKHYGKIQFGSKRKYCMSTWIFWLLVAKYCKCVVIVASCHLLGPCTREAAVCIAVLFRYKIRIIVRVHFQVRKFLW